jgi:hypothetical protein
VNLGERKIAQRENPAFSLEDFEFGKIYPSRNYLWFLMAAIALGKSR